MSKHMENCIQETGETSEDSHGDKQFISMDLEGTTDEESALKISDLRLAWSTSDQINLELGNRRKPVQSFCESMEAVKCFDV